MLPASPRSLQRRPNVEKRQSFQTSSRPMSTDSSASSAGNSSESTAMIRGVSTSQASTSTLPTSEDETGIKSSSAQFGMRSPSQDPGMPSSTKRHGLFLPNGSPVAARPKAPIVSPTKYTLHDAGPVSSILASSPIRNRLAQSPPSSRRPPQLESPTTPTRRLSAKELIDQFEQSFRSEQSPSAPPLAQSFSTPTRSPFSEARLNEPLPALPLEPPRLSPSSSSNKSPIRTLMNMVGLGRRGKRKSTSPTPKRRALLAEDDEASIPHYPNGSSSFELDLVMRKANSEASPLPSGVVASRGRDNEPPPILRAGPLLYAQGDSSIDSSWCLTQAVLQAPSLRLLYPNSSSSQSSDGEPFRSFHLRHATVESLPSIRLTLAAAMQLQLDGGLDTDGVMLYVFEVTLPPPGAQVGVGAPGIKEKFATTSPWDRGKWVCHIWDAVCSANEALDPPVPDQNPSAELTGGVVGRSSASSATVPDDDADLSTSRLQPPLRVVNVSKLSVLYDTVSTKRTSASTKPGGLDEIGRLQYSSTTSSGEHSTTSVNDSSKVRQKLYSLAPGQRSALRLPSSVPMVSGSTYGSSASEERQMSQNLDSSRDNPESPSIHNLSKLTLVQQRLAEFESTAMSRMMPEPSPDQIPDEEWAPPPPTPRSSRPRQMGTTSSIRSSAMGLTTPPSSPQRTLSRNTSRDSPSSSLRSEVKPQTPGSRFSGYQDTSSSLAASLKLRPKSLVTVPSEDLTSGDVGVPRSHVAPFLLASPFRRPVQLPSAINEDVFGAASSSETVSLRDTGHSDNPISRVKQDIGSYFPSLPVVSNTEAKEPVTSQADRWRSSAAPESAGGRLSAVSSLPATEFPDIAPLFSLVRDTAIEQAAQARVLTERLDAIRADLKVAVDRTPSEPSIYSSDAPPTPLDAPNAQSISSEEIKPLLLQIQERLDGLSLDLKSLPAVIPSDAVSRLQADVIALRDEGVAPVAATALEISGKLALLEPMHEAITALKDAPAAAAPDLEGLSTKLDGIAENVASVQLGDVNERLDAMRASLAVLEAVAQSQQNVVPPTPVSAFRNARSSTPVPAPLPVDLGPLHEKLDALSAAATAAGPSVDLSDVNGKLDALLALCNDVVASQLAAAEAKVPEAADTPPMEPSEAEKAESELPKFLELLQEDRTNQEKYYTDLNGWLQTNASQTATQYHSLLSQLQQLSDALAPLSQPVDPSIPGGENVSADVGASSEGAEPKSNLLLQLHAALVENNSRNKQNDNFLAAANHMMGAANAERQNLANLIVSQREENQKLLNHFAAKITDEIRGHKYSFVDAMEKATALNVEGQLQELKALISSQLLDMAKGVEQLLEERKGLEHQIAELLTFKNRFANPEPYTSYATQSLPISPGQYFPRNVSPARQPQPQQQSLVPLAPDSRYPVHPRQSPAPSRAASPSPSHARGRPLPAPSRPNTAPQAVSRQRSRQTAGRQF